MGHGGLLSNSGGVAFVRSKGRRRLDSPIMQSGEPGFEVGKEEEEEGRVTPRSPVC